MLLQPLLLLLLLLFAGNSFFLYQGNFENTKSSWVSVEFSWKRLKTFPHAPRAQPPSHCFCCCCWCRQTAKVSHELPACVCIRHTVYLLLIRTDRQHGQTDILYCTYVHTNILYIRCTANCFGWPQFDLKRTLAERRTAAHHDDDDECSLEAVVCYSYFEKVNHFLEFGKHVQ